MTSVTEADDGMDGESVLSMVIADQNRKLRERLLGARPPVGMAVLRIADVESQEIAWLWERWIPSRMLTLLGGYGGDGKSTVMASLIGRWTTGRELPDGSTIDPINVLMLSAEDDVAYALRPRLDLHGADPERVFVVQGTVRGDGRTRWLDLKTDVEVMREVIERHEIGLVVIDPLSSYLPRADRNSEGDIRDALQPLLGLMESTGVGIVGVMHIGKAGAGRRASQRLLGSTAFTALARSVLMLADVPDERQPEDVALAGKLKVLQVVKSNYSIPPAPMLFRRPLDAPVLWMGASTIDVERCFGGETRSPGPKSRERDEAEAFLREALAGGPAPAAELMRQAEELGLSESTVRRAKKRLGMVAMRRNAQAPWFWRLPTLEEAAPDGQVAI
jgi:putative DNA primase/helicase